MKNKKDKEIIIYYTNDMHGRLSTHDEDELSIGIDKISKIVNLTLLKNRNTFWFDAGDFSHGTPRMTLSSLDNLVDTLNSTHLNAIVTGNHDYNLAMEHLYELSKRLNAFMLSANTVDRETRYPVLLPYTVYSVDLDQNDFISKTGNSNDSRLDNIKIGVFGLSTPETAYKTNPNNVKEVEFLNPIETAKNMVKLLRNSCDIVIALTHLGLDDSSEFTSRRLAEEVTGMDLIIDGHSHTELPEGLLVNDTLIVQTGAHGKYLGKAVITLDNKTIEKIKTVLIKEEQVNEYIKNPDIYIEDKLNAIDKETESQLSKVIAYIDRELSGDRLALRRKECELGDIVADAFRWRTRADIAVVNGGTLRTGLPKGDITYGNIISIVPFGNSIQVAEVKGSTIREMLEHSVSGYPESFGGFLDISGMKFSFVPDSPIGNRIRDIEIKGEPIDEDKIYTICSLDFLFVGGDDYTMLKDLKIIGDFGKCEDIIVDYLNNHDIEKVDLGRIIVLNS